MKTKTMSQHSKDLKNKSQIKLFIILFAYCLLKLSTYTYSQGVAINTTGAVANPSSMLDVSSTDKGVLISRMNTAQRNSIASPAQGLLIYNTTTQCFEFYENSSWYSLGCTCTLPDIPECTAGSGATATQISANWNTATGATSYNIDVSSVSDFSSFVAGYENLNVGAVTTYDVTGLTCNTTYYYRIRAVNACGTTGSSNTITYSSATCFTCGVSTVNDIENNTYNTVLIGTQCWLKENMRTTKYPDNSNITKGPSGHGAGGWATDNALYSCPPNVTNNGEDCAAATTLGLLYQWSAAMNGAVSCNGTGSSQPECSTPVQGICPDGWHIPSHYEFVKLERQICGDNGGGTCNTDFPYDEVTTGWPGTNGEASDIAGNVASQNWTGGSLTGNANFDLSGLDFGPSGYRSGGFYFNRSNGIYWWHSTETAATTAWRRVLYYTMTSIGQDPNPKSTAFSVRCVKD